MNASGADQQDGGLAQAGPPASLWPTFAADTIRGGKAGDEHTIDGANVAGLKLLWQRKVDARPNPISAQPLYAPDVNVAGFGSVPIIYVASSTFGTVLAFNARDGYEIWGEPTGGFTLCRQDPRRNGRRVFGITGTPVIDRAGGVLYVADGQLHVHAFDLSTGREHTGWPVALAVDTRFYKDVVSGALAYDASSHTLYVPLSAACPNEPSLDGGAAVDTSHARQIGSFVAVNGGLRDFGGSIVGAGGMTLDPDNGDVFVATGPARGRGSTRNDVLSNTLVRLEPQLGRGIANESALFVPGPGTTAGFATSPVLFDTTNCGPQIVAVNGGGSLLTYDRRFMASGFLQRIETGPVRPSLPGQPAGGLAFDDDMGMLFLAEPSGRTVRAFSYGSCRFKPSWSLTLPQNRSGGLTSPTLANGVAYVGTARGQVVALDALSGKHLADIEAGPAPRAPVSAAPIVADGRLVAAYADGVVRVMVPAR